MKRCVILQIACAVIILSKVTLAKYYEKELLNLLKDAQGGEGAGRPGTPSSEESQDKCKKDILFMVDASKSVGRENMNSAKKFLKDLVHDPGLNVSPEGTHVAFMVFSSKETKYTKILTKFNHDHNPSSLDSIINRYEWNKNGYTRTDKALKMAREQIFKKPSPENHRDKIDDIIVLITDGRPSDDRWNLELVKEDTKREAEELIENKKVTIIGVGIGNNISWATLKSISGPVKPVKLKSFNDLPSIKKLLVDKSCVSPGRCTCPDVASINYLKPGETSKSVSWERPEPRCGAGVGVVHPESAHNSPTSFTHGEHEIKYTFVWSGNGKIDCKVKIIVKGPLCNGKEYNQNSQECCCGVIHVKKTGYECCGQNRFDIKTQQCCDGIIRKKDEDC